MSYRYAHSEGHTDLCYNDDSTYVITCGSEGDLRIWKGGADDVDQRDVCVGETATAVAQRGKNVYVGADGHCVQAYTWPAMETDGVMTRFTAPVTQIEVSPDGSLLAAASSDMEIHVVNMENMECKRLIGHKAPVLSIALDPKLEFLVSSSCDTTVQVWSLTTCTVVKKWDGMVAKSNSFELSESLCRPSFSPRAGTMIAVPTTTAGEVVIYERQSWNRLKTLTAPNETAVMSVVKFSPCGRLLCGGSTRGRVYIWDVTIERVVQSSEDKNSHAITALDWNLDSTTIALCNVAGQLANLIVQDSLSRSNSAPTEEAGGDLDGGETLGVPEFEDDDDDSENVISLEKIKASTLHQNGAGDFDEGSSVQNDGDEKSSVDEAYSRPHHTPLSELQQAFQPSSTPAHLLQRFMVWNSVGIVKQFNTEDSNEIEVEFHDTGVHHSFRINNLVGHSMAALSTSVLAMASPKSSDSPDSKLVCILLKAWDGQKEWDCRLEEWDAAVGVAAGANWVALATSSSVVRIYSADGTQRDVVSVPGPLVTLAASDDRLAIVFHTGQGSNGDQFMSYCLFRIHEGTRLASCLVEGALPMGTLSGGGCTLRWLGFTDENSLAALDFDGVLRVLYGRLWRPVVSLDQQCKSRFDHYFVVGVSETDQNVRCILCKGAYYPPVVPKPIVTEIKWQMPLCEMSSEKGRLEEEMLRNLITLPRVEVMAAENEDKEPSKMAIEKTISITVMKLFALACRSGLDGRAVALCEGMHSVDVVRLAAKYAAKLGRQQLANKIASIAEAIVHRSSSNEMEQGEYTSPADDITQAPPTVEYSQDMFEEPSNSAVRVAAKESLIQKMQAKNCAVSPKPCRIQKRGDNPFKKNINGSINSSTEGKDDSTNNIGERKQNFMEWFAQNRTSLQQEFPLLVDEELAIAGMRRYKLENKQHQQTESAAKKTAEEATTSVESKKRKLSASNNESSNENKQNGQPNKKLSTTSAKLKSFSFSKK